MPAPPTHTPLIALPALVLDLETTGLNVRADRVVQIGAIAVHGDTLLDQPRMDQLVNPEMPMPAIATSIHGLADSDVAEAPRLIDIISLLRELTSGRVVIGHHICFDLAILRHEAARLGFPWQEPPMLDVAQLFGALQPALIDLDLESVSQSLGVKVEGRHSAIGDCLATAQAWVRIIPMLRDVEIRTLSEAQSFAARRQDLMLRQAQAGWYAIPGEAVEAEPSMPSPMRIDSYAFERRLRELMSSPPLIIAPDTTLRAAANAMVDQHVGALLVGRQNTAPQGIVTERDLLRAAAGGTTGYLDSTSVTEIMTSPVETMTGNEMLYRALGRMDRIGIRHLCVVDFEGIPLGMISQRDLLHHRARGADMLSDALVAADGVATLAAAFARVPSVASRLVSEGLDGAEVARVVSSELRALTERAAELTIARMEAEGKGPPPAPWCVLVLGSGGRGESLLGTDQDNALIHAGTDADDAWFAELGAGMEDLLDAAGVPRCKGGVMASNAQWRGTVEAWYTRLDDWLCRARPQDLINVDIFFDLVPVAGDAELARNLHAKAVKAASTTPAFIGLLAQSTQAVAPRFGMLGGLATKEGRINLKRDGLLPLVSLARTLALRSGSRSRATPERLRDVAAAGRLSEGDAEILIEVHVKLLTLVLQQQLLDIGQGIPPSGRIVIKALSRKRRKDLMRGLRHLNTVVSEVRSLVSG